MVPVCIVCLAGTLAPAAASDHAMTVLEHRLAPQLEAGSAVQVPLTLRNDGTVTWDAAEGIALAYHWLREDGSPADWEGARTPLPRPVATGDTVSLTATVAVPGVPGRYGLQWDMVHEHVCWFSDSGQDPTPEAAIPVVVTASAAPGHAFTVVEHALPSWLASGSRRQVAVRIRNDGSRAWSPDQPINLSYHWFTSGGKQLVSDGTRTALPGQVEPGQTVELTMLLDVPASVGRLRLQLDLVHEGVCWFSQRDPTPEPLLPILVLPALGGGYPWLGFLCLVLIGVALVALRRWSRSWLLALLALADLVWAGSSLLLKQYYVLEVAPREPMPGYLPVTAGGVAVALLLLLALPRRARPWCALTLVAIGSTVILCDVIYLRFFGDVISAAIFGAAGQTGQVRESIFSLMVRRDVWLFADLPLALVLVLVVRRLQQYSCLRSRAVTAVVLVLALIPGVIGVVRVVTDPEGALEQVFHNLNVVERVGVLNYHLYDAVGFTRQTLFKPSLTAEQRAGVEDWFRDHAASRAGVGRWFGVARGRNLLMLQIESLQDYVIGLQVNGHEITPNLNRWQAGLLRFTRIYDQGAQGRTSDCELTSQASLLPLSSGAAAFRYPGNDYLAVAEILGEHGYTTLSAVPFDGSFWNRRLTHPAYGFQQQLFAADFTPGEQIGWGLNDRDFLAQMVPRLAALPQPFCAYLITVSLHHPFDGFPQHHKVLDLGDWEGTPFADYMHTMHFMDSALEPLIAGLQREGLLDDTIIALWGDHGSGILWRIQSKVIGRPTTVPHYHDTDRVPFLLRIPGDRAPRGEIGRPAGQTDFAPTLLALLGVDPAPYPLIGRNLLGEPGDEPVVRRYGTWCDPHLLYTNFGPRLEEGICSETGTMERVEVQRCRQGNERALRQVEVSHLVLSYDLQQELRAALGGDRGEAGEQPR